MSQAYKKALHGFFMKVHPDFFARNKEWQRANETSIAALNELLNWAKELKAGAHRAPPSTSIDFTFYKRPDDDGGVSPKIQTRFDLPKGFVAGPTTVGVAERAVNKFLRDLLRRSDCLDDNTSNVSEAQDSEQARAEARKTMNPRREPKRVRTLLDEAFDTAAEVAMPQGAPAIDDLIHSDQILFARDLSPQQCAVAVQTLASSLPELSYEQWFLVPVLITDHWGVGTDGVRGTMSIPWSFSVPQFQSFLRAEADAIKKMKQSTESFATEVESLIADVCRQLDVDDVLVTASHAESLPCLRLLREHAPLLALHGVQGVTIEIGDHFGARDNGVLMFDKAATFDDLKNRLPRIAERMPDLRKRYARARTLLQGIEWSLQQIVEALKPQLVDVFTADATYQERLQFVQELQRIAPQLAQFDWSSTTFALAPTENDLQIDWENDLMMLPCNFDGDNFVRYVKEIHSGAVEKEREKLAQFESSRRAKLEAQKAAAANLTDAMGDPSTDAVTDPDHDPMAGLDGRHAPPRPAADAWRSEYLMSSDKGGEELSVEAPLAHQRDFTNVTDAEDQLEWEGFNRTPYDDFQKPQADDDEMRDVWLNANKQYRTEAVRQVTAELRRKYGFVKDGLKLGDLVGINDPKQRARKFPTVARGSRPPPPGRQPAGQD